MRIKLKPKPAIKVTGRIVEPVTWMDAWDKPGVTYNPFEHGVTQSILSAFASCPQKFIFAYVERWTPVVSGRALDFGNLGHKALEVLAPRVAAGADFERTSDLLKQHLAKAYTADKHVLEENPTGNPNEFDDLEELYGLAHVTLEEYCSVWVNDAYDMNFVDVEKPFEFIHKLRDGRKIKVMGKFDAVYRTKNKALRLMETKFKGRIEEDTLVDKLSYDLQTQLYIKAMQQVYGEEIDGVLYNIVRRSQLRQKKAERRVDFLQRIRDDIQTRPEWYFIRNHVSFFPDELRRFNEDFDRRMEQFAYAWDNRLFYRESNACDLIGRKCPFMSMCVGSMPKGLYIRDLTMPELEVA